MSEMELSVLPLVMHFCVNTVHAALFQQDKLEYIGHPMCIACHPSPSKQLSFSSLFSHWYLW